MLNQIEQWIDKTVADYSAQRISCEVLIPYFSGYFKPERLKTSYVVIVDTIPKPDFPELRSAGLGDFLDMEVQGITYKNTYFIQKGFEQELRLHFHELVHVLQWYCLGAPGFIDRYIREIRQFGYNNAPLETMAYSLDAHFTAKQQAFDIEQYVQKNI